MSDKVFWAVLILIIGGFVAAIIFREKPQDSIYRDTAVEGVTEVDIDERQHVTEPVSYEYAPAIGGNHAPNWLDCTSTVYEQPVPQESAVHSLEHGAVWITYQPDSDEQTIETLRSKVEGSGFTFMSPYPDQSAPIILSSWGTQLELTDATDERIDHFLVKYRVGDKTPEPGATCSAPSGPAGAGSGLAPGETPEEHAAEGGN